MINIFSRKNYPPSRGKILFASQSFCESHHRIIFLGGAKIWMINKISLLTMEDFFPGGGGFFNSILCATLKPMFAETFHSLHSFFKFGSGTSSFPTQLLFYPGPGKRKYHTAEIGGDKVLRTNRKCPSWQSDIVDFRFVNPRMKNTKKLKRKEGYKGALPGETVEGAWKKLMPRLTLGLVTFFLPIKKEALGNPTLSGKYPLNCPRAQGFSALFCFVFVFRLIPPNDPL